MAIARNGDVRLHWREDGAGPPLLLLNSLGCDIALWDAAMPYLAAYRVLRMDMRGHGLSDSPPGDYSLDQLADDAASVLDAAGVAQAAVCGLSLGGMTAMALALKAPTRVSALVPACTSARMDREVWNARIAAVRGGGMAAVVDAVMTRFFSDEFRRDHPGEVGVVRDHFLQVNAEGYAGCCAAVRDMDLLDRITGIAQPALVIAGSKDVVTPVESHGGEIARRIGKARLEMIDTAHIAPVEKPEDFAALVTGFLRTQE